MEGSVSTNSIKFVSIDKLSEERIIFPDLLRILAIFFVILAHVGSIGFVRFPVSTFNWHVSNFYECLTRWSVPVFVMISGMFFLNPQKEITFSKLYRKNILRLVIALVFWGILYRTIGVVQFAIDSDVTFFAVIAKMVSEYSKLLFGPVWYHLWFLYMIIGLYILVPLIRIFTKNAAKKHYHYLFLIYAVFGSFLPLINDSLLFANSTLEINFKIMELMGFTIYFILGFYLYKYEVTKRARMWIYVAAVMSVIVQILGTYFISYKVGIAHQLLFEYSRPNVVIQTIAVYLFVKEFSRRLRFSAHAKTVISTLSKFTFGMYLAHDLFNILFAKIGFTVTCVNPVLAIPLRTLATFILSLAVVWMLDKVPVVKKYCI